MSLLAKNATPAELFVGCKFDENFRDDLSVTLNGGIINGNPTICDGADLDGVSDYIEYLLNGSEFNNGKISIMLKFWPNFNTNENLVRYFFAAVGGNNYLGKLANANNNVLRLVVGGTLIADIAESAYSPYWLVGKENVILISSISGDTSVWLNGVAILSNDPSGRASNSPTGIEIGARLGAETFDGKITQFKIFHSLLDAQDAKAYYTNSMYSYMNKAVINLPMTACQHKPDQVRTLDVSQGGNHAVFGNGVASTTFPTKLPKRGYNFNSGSNQRLDVIDSNSLDAPIFTIAILFETTNTGDQVLVCKNGALNRPQYCLDMQSGDLRIFGYEGASAKGFTSAVTAGINDGVIHSIITYFDGVVWCLILDGHILDTKIQAATLDDTDLSLQIGARNSTTFFDGDIFETSVFGFPLSSIQRADLHLRMLAGINDV